MRPHTIIPLALTLALALCLLPPAALHARTVQVLYGFHDSFPPLSYVENGQAKGFDLELLRLALEGSEYEVAPRPLPWEQVLLGLRQGGIHITSGMARTPAREQVFLFSERPSVPMVTRVYQQTKGAFLGLEGLKGKRVSVRRDSLYQYELQNLGPHLDIRLFPSHLQALQALFNGEVLAFGGGDRIAEHLIRRHNLHGISATGPPLAVTMLHYALRPDQEDLRQALDKGLNRLWYSGNYDTLYRKWFVRELQEAEVARLLSLAREGANASYMPYSLQANGAAVLSASGRYYAAGAVENGLPRLNSSALRVAVLRAVSSGDTDLRAALCLSSEGRVTPPDADDRRLLLEFGRHVLVVTEPSPRNYETRMIPELLPKKDGFDPWDGMF